MDPPSLAAGVIAIIQLADKIISARKGYVPRAKDAPNDLWVIIIEAGSVKCVLELTTTTSRLFWKSLEPQMVPLDGNNTIGRVVLG
jgi:hypothetical protein